MPDRKTSQDGTFGRSRHRSLASDQSSLTTSAAFQAAVPVLRRRLQRLKPIHDETLLPSSTTWVDAHKEEPRKATQRASAGTLFASPNPSVVDLKLSEREKDTIGFLPKLSRILEGKESKNPRRRRSSTASSAERYTSARRFRRPVEDSAFGRRPIRQKHGSLQRRAESLANLPNPSLISVLSGTTQLSSASSGSNSTITQQSYDKSHITKRRPIKERKRLQTRSASTKAKMTDPQQPNVFQYLNEGSVSEQFLSGDAHGERRSSPSSVSSYASSSCGNTEHDDGHSSVAEETLDESPMTSPASTRQPDHNEDHFREKSNSDSGIFVRERSPNPIHPAFHKCHVEEEDEEEQEQEQEEEEEEDTSESDDENVDDEAYSAQGRNDNARYTHHLAMERVPPPRMPSSSSSRHSDPHTRRMRIQEQELRDHVLQPQPQRDFQYVGGPSPYTNTVMPMYDVHSRNDADLYAHAPQPHGWPPQAPPQAPPPAAIGYYPPNVPPAPYYPPGPGNPSQNLMGTPHNAVLPPSYRTLQPPYYPPQPTEPDLSKPTVVGYEMLADKLTELSKNGNDTPGENTVVPMYRKFEQLNHRVLLHLQDEIAELEEELRHLDECIAQSSPRGETGYVYPASRRGDARYGGGLQYKRTDLLGRIYLKLGQYNQALASYNNMLKTMDAPSTEEIHAYHAWMQKHAPIDYSETLFLGRKTDLLAVSRRRSAIAVGGVAPSQSAAIGFPLILVLPLMAFAVVPGLLGRLFIVMLIGTAELMLVTSTELIELMTVKEWVACSSIYFGLMCVLAGVAH